MSAIAHIGLGVFFGVLFGSLSLALVDVASLSNSQFLALNIAATCTAVCAYDITIFVRRIIGNVDAS